MPTNYTSNYRLNQWERSDKVLMDDFNADNAKIDAALAFHPSAELICSVTVEEETTQLELDISQVDWSRYMALALIADTGEYNGFRVSMGSSERCAYMHSLSQNVYYNHSLVDVGDAAYMSVLIPVFYDGSHRESGLSITFGQNNLDVLSHFTGGAGSYRFNQCKQIRVSRNQKGFIPGDRAVLWGVK
ncbi:hypothetical protein [Lawsonibacter sp. JLR.KK007]|uniref:hypothetical protein n=1 Tax=Lawsonibacter sp. JLR.KK007 TaxID=3114293 RepID=UPI002FF37234